MYMYVWKFCKVCTVVQRTKGLQIRVSSKPEHLSCYLPPQHNTCTLAPRFSALAVPVKWERAWYLLSHELTFQNRQNSYNNVSQLHTQQFMPMVVAPLLDTHGKLISFFTATHRTSFLSQHLHEKRFQAFLLPTLWSDGKLDRALGMVNKTTSMPPGHTHTCKIHVCTRTD